MYTELLKEMTVALQTMLNEGDEVVKLQAKLCRKVFDALVAEGFSPEHAVTIIAHQGIGLTAKG